MKKQVVIAGMGFGGIRAARVLAGKGHDVILVDRNNYHLFQPLLYQVATAGPEQVVLHDGTVISAHTLFWSAGVKAAPIATALETPGKSGGRITVEPDLTLSGHPEVNVIGDMSYLEQDGDVLPMTAPVAMQMGIYDGKSILAKETGTPLRPFRYLDKGNMATIGRNAAVASAFGMDFRGYLAWLVWLLLHLYYLIGFRTASSSCSTGSGTTGFMNVRYVSSPGWKPGKLQ